MKVTIKALQNFGYNGENVEAGTILDIDTDVYGDTYGDHAKTAGLFETGTVNDKGEFIVWDGPVSPTAADAPPSSEEVAPAKGSKAKPAAPAKEG